MTDNDLRHLIVASKEGDNLAFARIYQELLTPIYRYIYFRVSDESTAKDLTQDVFLKVFKSLQGYSPDAVLSYFYTVARNVLIDWYRKKKIQTVDEGDFENILVEEGNPEQVFLQKDDSEKLREAISKLSVNEAEVITLKFIAELSNKEISVLLSKTEESVRQLQSRGLRNLRKILNKKDFEI
jgi:RNA polymerase sigma-70 factor (ECF subfamily)